MGIKLAKNAFPAGHTAEDFTCSGPPALIDGEFDNVKICDMGCFNQDGKDSNKMYHGAVVKSKKDGTFYAYFEWGRTGATNISRQFVQCTDEADAQREFAKQMHAKNDKRGEWVTIGDKRVLRAKAGDDCYLVRPMATRSTGLPDAKCIKLNDGAKKATPVAETTSTTTPSASKKCTDPQTISLLQDLGQTTVNFTRGSMADASLPTQNSINDVRDFLDAGMLRLKVVGDNVDDQVNDHELMMLTQQVYGRIPKKKALHCPAKDWILNASNIGAWRLDLDAFESALYAEQQIEHHVTDPLDGQPFRLEWIDPKSRDGAWLYRWWPKATANRHGHVGNMVIKNLWRVERTGDHALLTNSQAAIAKQKISFSERPPFQPNERPDLSSDESKVYLDTNTAALFHGSRSVNITGILREMLRLPKQLVGVMINGAAYGPGMYFADDWKKSSQYTDGGYYIRGSSSSSRGAFMFAADVVLGSPWVAPRSGGYTSPLKGHHCIFAKAGHSGVVNNEWITFERNHVELRYLVEFTAR